MPRKRDQPAPPDPPDPTALKRSFLQRLRGRLDGAGAKTPQEAAHLLCAVALSACAGTYPDPGLWSQLGLGTTAGLLANWLSALPRRSGDADPPDALVSRVLDDGAAREELSRFLTSQGLMDAGVCVLEEYGVATRDDVRCVLDVLGRVEGKLDRVLDKVKPDGRKEPTTLFAVPFPSKGEAFVGRAAEMGRLHAMLGEARPVGIIAPAIKPAGVTGQGGIGKTQLAVEYAHTHRDACPGGVYWVNAAGDLVEGLARCAQFAGFGESGADLSDLDVKRALAHDLYRWLQGHPDSLLVLDNLANPTRLGEPLFGDLVLSSLPCRLLFTSRSRAFDLTAFSACELTVLPREASLDLLLGHRKDATQRDADEWAAADEICRMLGDLALAVEQAGAYLRKWPQVLVSGYRDRLREEGLLATADDTPLTEEQTTPRHAVGLAVMLRHSAEGLAPNALLTLRVLAEFPENEMVPRHRVGLAAGLSHEPQRGRPDALSVAVEELMTASLVDDLEGARLRLHPLVRDFARSLTPEAEREAWLQQLAVNLAKGLGDVEYLERRVKAEGIYALLEDFIAVDGAMPQEGEAARSARSLHRLFDLGSHNLIGWDPRVLPGGFLQHVANQALDVGMMPVRDQAEGLLRKSGMWYLRQLERRGEHEERLLRVLTGRRGSTVSVALSPDGRRVVTGDLDGTVRVWDMNSGQELVRFEGHTNSEGHPKWVLDAIFSADGHQVMSASADNTARVWEVSSGTESVRLELSAVLGLDAAFSPDGRMMAVASIVAMAPPDHMVVAVLEMASGREIARLRGHTELVLGIAFSPDGQWVGTASQDGTVRVWEAHSGRQVACLCGHQGCVRGVAFSPDGQRVVSGGDDNTVRVWGVLAGEELARLEGHGLGVCSVAFSPDGSQVASASFDQSVRVWDVTSGRSLAHFAGHGDWVNSVAFTPDGRQLVSGSNDGATRVWRVTPDRATASARGHADVVWSAAFSADGEQVASGSRDNTARVWDVGSGKELARLEGHASTVDCVAFSRGGNRVATGSFDHTVRVWDAGSARELSCFAGHTEFVLAVSFSPDGLRVVSGSGDKTLRVWEVSSGKELACMTGHSERVYRVTFSPDGKCIASGARDGTVRVWDVHSATEVALLDGHEGEVTSLFFLSDVRLASGCSEGGMVSIRVWDLSSRVESVCLRAQGRAVSPMAFSPNGHLVAWGEARNGIRVWDVGIGEELAWYPTTYSPLALWWSPGGRIIKAADTGGGTNRPHIYELELVGPRV